MNLKRKAKTYPILKNGVDDVATLVTVLENELDCYVEMSLSLVTLMTTLACWTSIAIDLVDLEVESRLVWKTNYLK